MHGILRNSDEKLISIKCSNMSESKNNYTEGKKLDTRGCTPLILFM